MLLKVQPRVSAPWAQASALMTAHSAVNTCDSHGPHQGRSFSAPTRVLKDFDSLLLSCIYICREVAQIILCMHLNLRQKRVRSHWP